jgi:hypothetical protein
LAAFFLALPPASTDEVYDFEPVAIMKRRLSPPSALHDLAIELHGHAIRFHPQVLDQRS